MYYSILVFQEHQIIRTYKVIGEPAAVYLTRATSENGRVKAIANAVFNISKVNHWLKS